MKISSLFYKAVFPFAALSVIGFSGKAEEDKLEGRGEGRGGWKSGAW